MSVAFMFTRKAYIRIGIKKRTKWHKWLSPSCGIPASPEAAHVRVLNGSPPGINLESDVCKQLYLHMRLWQQDVSYSLASGTACKSKF
jgi:hypothetical protein